MKLLDLYNYQFILIMTSVTITFGEKQTSLQYNNNYDDFMAEVENIFKQLPKDTWKLIYQDNQKDFIQIWNQWDFAEMLKEKNSNQISLFLAQDESQQGQEINQQEIHQQEINEENINEQKDNEQKINEQTINEQKFDEQRQVEQRQDKSQQIERKQKSSDDEENIDEEEIEEDQNNFGQSNQETSKIRQAEIDQIQQDQDGRQGYRSKSRYDNRQNFIDLEASVEKSKQGNQLRNRFSREELEERRRFQIAAQMQGQDLMGYNYPRRDDRPPFRINDQSQKRQTSAQEMKQIQQKVTVFVTSLSEDRTIYQYNQEQLFIVLLCHIVIKRYRNQKFKERGGFQQLKKFLDNMSVEIEQMKKQRRLGLAKNTQVKQITNQTPEPKTDPQSQGTNNQIRVQSQEITNQKTTNQIRVQSQEGNNQTRVESRETTNEIRVQSREINNQIRIQPETINQVQVQPERINQMRVQQEAINKIHLQSSEVANQPCVQSKQLANQETTNQTRVQSQETSNQVHVPRPNTEQQKDLNQKHDTQQNETLGKVDQLADKQANKEINPAQESSSSNINQNEQSKAKQHPSSMKNGQSILIAISENQCNRIQSNLELLVSQVDSLSKQFVSLEQSIQELKSIQHSSLQLDAKDNNMPSYQQTSNIKSEIQLCKSCKAKADVVYLQGIYLCHKCQNYLSIKCKPRPVNKSEFSNPLLPKGNSSQI